MPVILGGQLFWSVYMKYLKRFVSMAAAAALVGSPVALANVSGTMDVTLELENGCIVSGSTDPIGAVNFGTMDFGSAPTLFSTNLYAQSMISSTAVQLECSAGASLNIQVGDGQNAAAGVRRMSSGANYVAYRLYSQPNAGGTEYTVGGAPVDVSALVPVGGGAFNLPIYGVVAPQAGLVAGNYSDQVSIVLTF
jgi:spore coat protein U-like protein